MCRVSDPKEAEEHELDNNINQGVFDDADAENDTFDDCAAGKEKLLDGRERPQNMLETASFFSRLLFYWPYPLLKLGMERPLEETDLPEIMKVDSSRSNRMYAEELWKDELRRHPRSPSLHRALLRDYFSSLWYIQPMLGIGAVAKIVQAIVLGLLVESFENGTAGSEGYLLSSILVAAGVVIIFEHHHVFFVTWRKGMQLRISSIAMIYSKSLRLSSTHQETNASTGRIMNLVSNDVERFLMAALFINYIFWSPVQSIAILVVGWKTLGPAFGAGFALLVFFYSPFQWHLSRKFALYRSKIASITDRRVTLVSQAVHGARVMKMAGYEWRFLDRIQGIRREEIDGISSANRLKAWNETLFFSSNVVFSLVIFLVHVMLGESLTPRDVFTVFTLINIMQLEMTKHVSLGIMGVSEAYVSVKRIQAFLEFPEFPQPKAGDVRGGDSIPEGTAISLSNVCCYWNQVQHVSPKAITTESETKAEIARDSETTDSTLVSAISDVTLDLKRGEITCVIGTVGSGKSALIQALVGELPIDSGKLIRSYETLAYSSQDPWIMDGSVRDNITMGAPFRKEWYDDVVGACGLPVDFGQFLNGDLTIVGDRGVQCSGGQRARIGLARALYRDADVLIVDDPLSAVDAKVGRQLFNKALLELGVKRGKCVVVATHQHQYVNDHRCVLVSNGIIEKIGSYQDCVAAAGESLTAHAADDAVDELPSDEPHFQPATISAEQETAAVKAEKVKKAEEEVKEEKNVGVVRLETYKNYAKAMGGLWVAGSLLFLFIITQGSSLASVAMMGRWAERPPEEQDDWDILGLVIGLSVSVLVLAALRARLCFEIYIGASQKLHDQMTKAVLQAKISFFDTNPLGRILNRFSADVGSNDDMLPQTLFDFSVIMFIVLGAVVTTITVLPFALVTLPPLIWYFLSVRRIFVHSSRELKRLEGISRSPIFAMLNEALSGISTIRANGSVDFFFKKFEFSHDAHTRAFFAFMGASRWVGFRMDVLMFFLMGFVSFLSVLFQDKGWFIIDPAILGLSISTLLQLAGIFQWCIRQSAEVVNQMVSVERVLSYGHVESEAPLECSNDKELEAFWPDQGAIDVKDLAVRYRPALPRALDGISFSIPAGSHVGIVGRTGSGKSTVVQTLFRLLEAEQGSVSIDGVDVSTVGLHRLRTRISVIPQIPTLFSGCTVKENLDLFGIHSEEEVYKALKDAHMAEAIAKLPKGIHSPVSEGGSNFSVGQRQLLCLARASLSKNKLLVLDEATASVDRRTDQMLHESLEESFGGATILAVAHRLDTVIEHDFILVLGKGKVLEFGRPAELLRRPEGPFRKMVEDTGDIMSNDLKKRAFAKEEREEQRKTPNSSTPTR